MLHCCKSLLFFFFKVSLKNKKHSKQWRDCFHTFLTFLFCQINPHWSSPVCSRGTHRSRECLHINQKMDLSDSSRVADTEIWMIYLSSVITVPLGIQSDVIYTGTGLQAGGGLDGFAIWRHAVRSLGRSCAALSHFKLFFLFFFLTAPSAMKTNTSQRTKQKTNMGKWGVGGAEEGIGPTRPESHIFHSVNTWKKTQTDWTRVESPFGLASKTPSRFEWMGFSFSS